MLWTVFTSSMYAVHKAAKAESPAYRYVFALQMRDLGRPMWQHHLHASNFRSVPAEGYEVRKASGCVDEATVPYVAPAPEGGRVGYI